MCFKNEIKQWTQGVWAKGYLCAVGGYLFRAYSKNIAKGNLSVILVTFTRGFARMSHYKMSQKLQVSIDPVISW